MGNKQELEMYAQLQGFGTGIMEAWWDASHDWSIRTEGQVREGPSPSVSVSSWSAWSWVSITEMAGTGNIITGVCYRPPDQEDQAERGSL